MRPSCVEMLTRNASRILRTCWSQAPKSVTKALELTTEMAVSLIRTAGVWLPAALTKESISILSVYRILRPYA